MGGDKHLNTHYRLPWYELYDGDKPVVVGRKNYTGTTQPFVYQDRVFGLDTDCVTGKALTGLLLPAFRFVSVPSRGGMTGSKSSGCLQTGAAQPTETAPYCVV